jgi:hypothetical protein
MVMAVSQAAGARSPEENHDLVRNAIVCRRPIAAVYDGRQRLLCPYKLGWNKERRLQVLCYQYGGASESGLGRRVRRKTGAAWRWTSSVTSSCGQALGRQQKTTHGLKRVSIKSRSM